MPIHPPLFNYDGMVARIMQGDIDQTVVRTILSYWISPSPRDANITEFVTCNTSTDWDGLVEDTFQLYASLNPGADDKYEVSVALEWLRHKRATEMSPDA